MTMTTGPVIEATGLYHIYREGTVETVALRGANLTLAPGSWTSVMGPSGSGKSTLLQILAGLLAPTAGAVRVAGTDLSQLSPDEWARQRRGVIGVMLQRDNLHPLLDVAANIALPLRLAGQPRARIRERVAELLAEVRLTGRRRYRGGQLSGGEAQRAAVAVALAAQPRVLLADEPTGELDEGTAEVVLDLLESVRTRHGTTLLTVTHNDAVTARADRRVTMHDGVISDER